MTVIDIENLSFAYDKQIILENINLKVEEKDFLAIIGPNGGGKSTLLKLILGMNPLKIGSISVLGKKPTQSQVVMMGHVEGKQPLFGYGKHEVLCATGALEQVGMADFVHTKIGSLSGGQRQRVMIARALCAHPKILILDEPTSSIDITGQREIYELLKVLNEYITIIVVSHDISVILEYANKAAHVNKNLSYHDISDKQSTFHKHGNDEHFCEIELLQMLGSDNCNTCDTSASSVTDNSSVAESVEAKWRLKP